MKIQKKNTRVMEANDTVEVRLNNAGYSYLRYQSKPKMIIKSGTMRTPALKTTTSGCDVWLVGVAESVIRA